MPLFPEKHRGEDTHGKHGAHGHGSQLGGTVSNKVSKCRNTVRCVLASRLRKQANFYKLRSGFTLRVYLCIWGVCAFLHGTKRLLACLLVATLLTTGPVVVRLAEMTIYRVREQVVPLLVVCIHASKVLQVFSV